MNTRLAQLCDQSEFTENGVFGNYNPVQSEVAENVTLRDLGAASGGLDVAVSWTRPVYHP
jgi:hypothetical protein